VNGDEFAKGGGMGRMARAIVTFAVVAVSMELLLVAGRILMPDAGLGRLFAAVALAALLLGTVLWCILPREDD